MNDTALITSQTMDWVRSFVIAHNLCPFAKAPVNKGRVRIAVALQRKKAAILEDLMAEVHYLDEHPEVDTTLLVLPDGFNDFFTYLDLVDLAEQLMNQLEYEGIYQLASFHPNYYFADTDPDDSSNYTNRSPYPMLHILREDQLEKAIAAYGDTQIIPERNNETLRRLARENIIGN